MHPKFNEEVYDERLCGERRKNSTCRFSISAEQHEIDHKLIADATEVLARWKDAKWGIFQGVIVLLVFSLITGILGILVATAVAKLKAMV